MEDLQLRYTLRVRCLTEEWIESFATKAERSEWQKVQRNIDELNGLETLIVDESTSIYAIYPEDGHLMWMCDCQNDVIEKILSHSFKHKASK